MTDDASGRTAEEKARSRELRARCVAVVRGVGTSRPFAEHLAAVTAALGEPGCPPHDDLTTPRGLTTFARQTLRHEPAPREPDVPAPGDHTILGGKRRRIVKGEFPGQNI